jgi:hypothetical protein
MRRLSRNSVYRATDPRLLRKRADEHSSSWVSPK